MTIRIKPDIKIGPMRIYLKPKHKKWHYAFNVSKECISIHVGFFRFLIGNPIKWHTDE
jgi:hypothetical protein